MSQNHIHWLLVLSGATPSARADIARLPTSRFLFLTDSMIDEQAVRRWYDPLYEDGFGNDELNEWSYSPWLSAQAWIPYRDDDFGWRNSTIRWVPRGPTDHYLPPQDEPNPWAEAEVQSELLTVASHSDGDSSNAFEKVPLDILYEFIFALLPDHRLVPLHDFWRGEGEGAKVIKAVTALSSTCRLWHTAVRHAPNFWAGVAPAVTTVHAWNIASSRAHDTPMRIAYRGSIPWPILDARVQEATAVYAGAECSWREFGRVLLAEFDIMPNVEVMFLRPNMLNAAGSVMESPSSSVFCPLLRYCSANAPILVDAPVMERLEVANHTSAQLTDLLTLLRTLQRLDIGAISGAHVVDFSSLLSVTATARLQFLRIRSKRSRDDLLDIHRTPLHMPCLTLLDVSAPILIDAPAVEFARVYDVQAAELLHMLSRIASVVQLYACWREDPARLLLPLSLPLPTTPTFLPELREIYLAEEISRDTVDFFRGIRAPALIGLQAFCDPRAPPIHNALPSLIEGVEAALDTHSTDAGRLHDVLENTQDGLTAAGYFLLADALDVLLVPGLTDDFLGPEPDHTVAEYVDVATNVLQRLREALRSPPVPHGGHLVREVALATMHAAGIVIDAEEDLHLHISEDVRAIHLDVLFKGVKHRRLRFSAAGPNNCFTNRPWETSRFESAVYSIARVMYGLQVFRPRRLRVEDDPFAGVLPKNLGTGDVSMLQEVLQDYDDVHTLQIDHRYETMPSNGPSALLEVLHSALTLPNLRTLNVSVSHVHRDSPFWQQLECMLVDRSEGENPVTNVIVDGRGCVPWGWAERIRRVVGSLDTTLITCAISSTDLCFACRFL